MGGYAACAISSEFGASKANGRCLDPISAFIQEACDIWRNGQPLEHTDIVANWDYADGGAQCAEDDAGCPA
jgi:hypothetical protein